MAGDAAHPTGCRRAGHEETARPALRRYDATTLRRYFAGAGGILSIIIFIIICIICMRFSII
jgi:hypothetical protein